MNKRNVVRGLVLAILALGAIPAAAKEHAFKLDKTIKFPKSYQADLNFKAGPLTFTEIIIRNPPNAGDIKNAETKDKGDNCHPKFSLGVSNDGKEKMQFHVVVSLEDDAGTVYFKCDRDDSIDSGAENDHTNMCLITSMKTIDWPKLTVVRIKAEIDPD
jgi:hypothetical protein